jgi:hypothetical protein
MKKLTLAVEELEVASFETETADGERGTVAAHGLSGPSCPCQTWLTRNTCCTPLI